MRLVLAGHGLPLPLQRKNQSSPTLESSQKMLCQQSDIANGSAAADANEQTSENDSQRPARFTKGVSYEAQEAKHQELTRPMATDLTCMVTEVATANHKNVYGTGVILG